MSPLYFDWNTLENTVIQWNRVFQLVRIPGLEAEIMA